MGHDDIYLYLNLENKIKTIRKNCIVLSVACLILMTAIIMQGIKIHNLKQDLKFKTEQLEKIKTD